MDSIKCKKGSSEATIESASRRRFTGAGVGLFVATGLSPFLVSMLAQAKDSAGEIAGAPAADDIANEAVDAMAELGVALKASQPAIAAKLEAAIPGLLGVASLASVSLADARKAHAVLEDQQRVAQELSRGEVVFVEGWLLTHSEAGVILLYALAQQRSTVAIEAAQ